MGFYFYPRGGSAQVARYLSRSLAGGRWAPTLFAGSLGGAAQACNARHFFGGVRCEPLDYTPAADAWSAGCDPMAMAVPMHASYESKADVPDRVFGDLDDRAYDLQVASWVGFLSQRAVGVPSVVHLHHLTPMHAAVRRVWPRVPLITHLHGTELKMLAAIRDDPLDLECGRYGVAWATRMQSWAGRSDRVVVVSATDHALALDLLPLTILRVEFMCDRFGTGEVGGQDQVQRILGGFQPTGGVQPGPDPIGHVGGFEGRLEPGFREQSPQAG